MNLTFNDFETFNRLRNNKVFKTLGKVSQIHWSNAIAGEAGELCNLTKKRALGRDIKDEDIHKEVADVITYCFLFLMSENVSVEDVVIDKFNEVSRRNKSDVIIELRKGE